MSDMPDEYGAPVKMECGCSWHETTSWLLCDECSKLDCFAPPKNYKTALELFEGNDLNLKSSSGVRQYAFNSYAVRRITNALRKHDEYQSERAAMAAEVERLRGAIDGAIKQLKEEGDRDYCRALDIADKNCKGAQYKLESGKFSNDDLKWHCKLHELIGKHRGIYYAMNLLHRLQSALAGGKEG